MCSHIPRPHGPGERVRDGTDYTVNTSETEDYLAGIIYQSNLTAQLKNFYVCRKPVA